MGVRKPPQMPLPSGISWWMKRIIPVEIFPGWDSTLNFIQCSDTVGQVTGRGSSLKKPVLLILQGSLNGHGEIMIY